MSCPTLNELPTPPPGKIGWPWTKGSTRLAPTLPDGTSWPRVSIVTPSYNQGEFIEETIRSVLLQGYPNLEYIIVDGGSTDESVEIIRKYEPWLAHWESQPDRGQSHAINKGFHRARGEIVAWLNSDDYYLPDAFYQAITRLIETPESVFVYSDCDFKEEATGEIRRVSVAPRSAAQMIRDGNCVSQPTTFIRKSVLNEVGLLDESFHMIMDYDLWIRIKRRFPVTYLEHTSLAVAREYATAKSIGSSHKRCPEFIRLLDQIYANQVIEPEIQKVRREAYGRVYLHCAVAETYQGRAFPNGLHNYTRALLCRPRLALARPLAPFWFLREAMRQSLNRESLVGGKGTS
jgi:glycosyltransferase involved in cell wall biosynthesis